MIENAKKSCPNTRFQAIIKAFAGEPINTTMAPKAQIPLNRSGKRTEKIYDKSAICWKNGLLLSIQIWRVAAFAHRREENHFSYFFYSYAFLMVENLRLKGQMGC